MHPNSFTLERLGWDQFFNRHFEPYAALGLEPGRVWGRSGMSYRVLTRAGDVPASLAGSARFRNSHLRLPAVGDWVVLSMLAGEARAVIRDVLPRKNHLTRKEAGARTREQIVGANIDTVFLMTSLNRDFNPRRLERFLTLVLESGAEPAVLLNKSDLGENPETYIDMARAVAGAAGVHAISALTGAGLEALDAYIMMGRTVALLGSSGVGKSTLVNALAGCDIQRVSEIRADGRGRHTTTRRELILLPRGGVLLDTPGLREIQLWEGGAGIKAAFSDIDALAANCRFRNCRHETEPECAVRSALESGEIDGGRFRGYDRLRRELKHMDGKRDRFLREEEKRRWKQLMHDAGERSRFKRGDS